MAALAVDIGAATFVDGIVDGQLDGAVGDPVMQDEIGHAVGEGPERPAVLREDAAIAGGMAGGQPAEARSRSESYGVRW